MKSLYQISGVVYIHLILQEVHVSYTSEIRKYMYVSTHSSSFKGFIAITIFGTERGLFLHLGGTVMER